MHSPVTSGRLSARRKAAEDAEPVLCGRRRCSESPPPFPFPFQPFLPCFLGSAGVTLALWKAPSAADMLWLTCGGEHCCVKAREAGAAELGPGANLLVHDGEGHPAPIKDGAGGRPRPHLALALCLQLCHQRLQVRAQVVTVGLIPLIARPLHFVAAEADLWVQLLQVLLADAEVLHVPAPDKLFQNSLGPKEAHERPSHILPCLNQKVPGDPAGVGLRLECNLRLIPPKSSIRQLARPQFCFPESHQHIVAFTRTHTLTSVLEGHGCRPGSLRTDQQDVEVPVREAVVWTNILLHVPPSSVLEPEA